MAMAKPKDELGEMSAQDLNALHEQTASSLESGEDLSAGDESEVEVSTGDIDVTPSPLKVPSFVQEDEDFDVPTSFWDSGHSAKRTQEKTVKPAQNESPSEDGREPSDGKTVRVKADGKWYDVDITNQKELQRELSLAKTAPRVMSENDLLKKQVEALQAETNKFKETFAKFETMTPEKLFELKAKKSLEDYIKEKTEWQERYKDASPEEKRIMELAQRQEKLEKDQKLQSQAWDETKTGYEKRIEAAEMRELKAVLYPEFHRNDFSKEVSDPEQADALNDMLWNAAINKLDKDHGEDVEITPQMAKDAFSHVKRILIGTAKSQAEKKVREITTAKKESAKRQAQVASTRNYKTKSVEDFANLAGDATALWRAMTGQG